MGLALTVNRKTIQFLAAMANARARERFAEVVLRGDAGAPRDDKLDRLLIDAGVFRSGGDFVRVDAAGLRELLAAAREERGRPEERPLEQLPRRLRDRVAVLSTLAARIVGPGERVTESELGARLAPSVIDVAAVRRAMVDHGILDRDPDTQQYWLVGPGGGEA